MTDSAADLGYMRAALSLARRGLGRVAPNPAVGCIIVSQNQIVGRGWTQPGGRPHAETEALAQASIAARGSTVYVTLEPCSHHGQTGPCAEALVKAGVARCVVAMNDPDERVRGRGVNMLREAGIAVETGLLRHEAERVNAGYLLHRLHGRPLVTLKLATTLDGRIATHTGESQWITGNSARAFGHRLRATHDAILIGGRTALYDNPRLDCRLPGLETRSPLRVIMDGSLVLPLTHHLVANAGARAGNCSTLLFTREGHPKERVAAYRSAGVEVIELRPDQPGGLLPPDGVLEALAARGVTRVLCEGGGGLAASLVRAGLVDRLIWFRAARLLGDDGRAGLSALGIDSLKDSPRFRLDFLRCLGEDLLESYSKAT
ncbi:bifunctional diaminohydroxyphosphoribosylaminopyrimidine deaminase/5-amino-6-(5-phosphoribosylamino)uracil reductase RibD [Limibacillus sp. MBR-115]|uniref:bifunctional diaminohydroxyphosphoribosylaminopyrimidine deaminase/5-amino-6-(5-phosphoribosylamino)uracil reductase RibD n=1 Tax=Limibacillus sp. MBR-115 TaxID=3156465 RepID=UPI003393DCA0